MKKVKVDQKTLDKMLRESIEKTCSDCGVKIGKNHKAHCMVAQCNHTGEQRWGCDCGKCGKDRWTGINPGRLECYALGLVVEDRGEYHFDLNTYYAKFQKK